jgi:hypothetical protein
MTKEHAKELVLSPQANRLGGAIARIIGNAAETERYASTALKSIDGRAIGDLVVAHPELNNDQTVGGLVWLSTFHGEPMDLWIDQLLDEGSSIEHIILSIEYLYDKGQRTNAASALKDDEADKNVTREYVPMLLELLEAHTQLESDGEVPIRTVDQLDTLVEALGGLYALGDHDRPESIADALYAFRHSEGS